MQQIFGTETNMVESNNTAYAAISVLQNSPNGFVAFNITVYDGAGNEFSATQVCFCHCEVWRV